MTDHAPTPGEPGHNAPDRYRALVHATSQHVWSWSPTAPPREAERTQHWWADLTGQSILEQQRTPHAWLDVVHPEDRHAAETAWTHAISRGDTYDSEYRVRDRRGGWRHVRVRGVPIRDTAGELLEWFGTIDDVTDTRHALLERERHLAESDAAEKQQRLLETALFNTADFVYLFDTGGRFTFANKPLLDLWNKSLPEAVGRDFHELGYPAELADRLQSQIRQVVTTARPVRDETPFTSDAGTRLYEYIFMPVIGTDGTVEAVAGSTRDITDRERGRSDLRASEERYRALVTASADVVYRMSPDWSEMQPIDGRDLIASAAVPLRDWLQRNVPPEEHDRIRHAIEQAIRTRSLFELEHRVIRPDGSIGWTHSRAAPILDHLGNITEWFGTARDVTHRRRTEEDLTDIRSRMEAALAAGAIGTWSWDIQADRFSGDASLARIFSLDPDQVASSPLASVVHAIHPDDRPRVADAITEAIDSGGRYETEYRVVRPDGTCRWVNARGQVELDPQGRPARFPGVVIDITDRKTAQQDLALLTDESDRRRRLYETILSNTPDLAYVFDLEHRFIYANETLLKMWGKAWDEAIGKTCLELGYAPWHASMHDREIEQVKATRQPIRGEVPFHGTFGRRDYDYIFVPVINDAGEVEAVAGTTRDVTDRKASEEALRDADRKKDDFIALLAHELRNPLAPIRNGLQVLRLASNDPETAARARAMMERQLNHMVRLIDDLLDISRITRNKMELRLARVPLADLVTHAVETAGPAIREPGHTLTVDLPAAPIHIDADLTRMGQVLSNLLTNSAKYTPPGGHIRLTARRDAGQVVIDVADNGLGIPAESLPHIFDMFNQVDRINERSTGGLGIGLALVKGLVEMHGGSVSVESTLGAGSTFTVRLPAAEPAPALPAPASADQPAPPARRRVLVVDDHRDSADSMAALLRVLGNEVALAHDGAEAVETAESFRPALILMDIGLPVFNGLEATRRIREQPWGAAPTIVALTGWGQDSDRLQSRAAGCDGHLVKPVDFAALERVLAQIKPEGH
jgi:PAS domain S-box-containing protein